MLIDYVAKLDCTLREEPNGVRVLRADANVIFLGLSSQELRSRINEAMANAVAWYARNVKASGVAIESERVEAVALCVVLHHLYIYNGWRDQASRTEQQPLVVGVEELEQVGSHDQCLFFCEKHYGERYAEYAAALTGMTPAEFARYEIGRRRFWDR